MPAEPKPAPRSSLRRVVAAAFALLVAVVVAAAICQFILARTVHHDVQRLFEELREVSLARVLVDELRGVEQWVESVPQARAESHQLVFDDVHQHTAAAIATVQRFSVLSDPSTKTHEAKENLLLLGVDQALQDLAAALEAGSVLADLVTPLASARHQAATLFQAIERETRQIGDNLDRRSDDMAQFLLLLGFVSIATVAGLGWLLVHRVLRPVRQLQQAAIRLGAGELEVPLPQRHRDELGDLATTFRTMAERLREGRQELEARVAQRSREVLRSARLAQIGTLAAGIAHEINNPLASIVACAEGLLRDVDRNAPDAKEGMRDYLQILRKEALRARDITVRLLRFARDDAPRREPVSLAVEVREVAAMFAHQMHDAGVALQVTTDEDATTIGGDAAEWRQVLFNLLRNALDASPRGSTITVTVATSGSDVELAVHDEGPGIPEAQHDLIFEPFFTTKEPGHGTGLGLAIVHRIVQAHGGRITVQNATPGARFTITVPRDRS